MKCVSEAFVIQTVLAQMKAEHKARFEGFLQAPLESPAALRKELDGYVELLRTMSARIPMIDFALVSKLAHACQALLQIPEGEPRAHLANAAVRYFLRKEDDYDETTSVLNFSDDVDVINAVCVNVGLDHLVVSPTS